MTSSLMDFRRVEEVSQREHVSCPDFIQPVCCFLSPMMCAILSTIYTPPRCYLLCHGPTSMSQVPMDCIDLQSNEIKKNLFSFKPSIFVTAVKILSITCTSACVIQYYIQTQSIMKLLWGVKVDERLWNCSTRQDICMCVSVCVWLLISILSCFFSS